VGFGSLVYSEKNDESIIRPWSICSMLVTPLVNTSKWLLFFSHGALSRRASVSFCQQNTVGLHERTKSVYLRT